MSELSPLDSTDDRKWEVADRIPPPNKTGCCGFRLRLMCAIKAKLLRNSIEEMFMKTYISAAFPPPLHTALVHHPSTQGKHAVQPLWTAVAARRLFGDAGADGRLSTISFSSYF